MSYFIGLTKLLTERIRKMLKMLEPMMLPTAMSQFFFTVATTEVANSGNEVPAATIVSPITRK